MKWRGTKEKVLPFIIRLTLHCISIDAPPINSNGMHSTQLFAAANTRAVDPTLEKEAEGEDKT